MRTVLAVIIKDGCVVAYETNRKHICKREGYPTGEGYDLCEPCQPHNHAEQRALDKTKERDATLYLFGHTYACDSCKRACEDAGVTIVIP